MKIGFLLMVLVSFVLSGCGGKPSEEIQYVATVTEAPLAVASWVGTPVANTVGTKAVVVQWTVVPNATSYVIWYTKSIGGATVFQTEIERPDVKYVNGSLEPVSYSLSYSGTDTLYIFIAGKNKISTGPSVRFQFSPPTVFSVSGFSVSGMSADSLPIQRTVLPTPLSTGVFEAKVFSSGSTIYVDPQLSSAYESLNLYYSDIPFNNSTEAKYGVPLVNVSSGILIPSYVREGSTYNGYIGEDNKANGGLLFAEQTQLTRLFSDGVELNSFQNVPNTADGFVELEFSDGVMAIHSLRVMGLHKTTLEGIEVLFSTDGKNWRKAPEGLILDERGGQIFGKYLRFLIPNIREALMRESVSKKIRFEIIGRRASEIPIAAATNEHYVQLIAHNIDKQAVQGVVQKVERYPRLAVVREATQVLWVQAQNTQSDWYAASTAMCDTSLANGCVLLTAQTNGLSKFEDGQVFSKVDTKMYFWAAEKGIQKQIASYVLPTVQLQTSSFVKQDAFALQFQGWLWQFGGRTQFVDTVVLRSLDGFHWQKLTTSGLPFTLLTSVVVHGNRLYAIADNVLYVSADGLRWQMLMRTKGERLFSMHKDLFLFGLDSVVSKFNEETMGFEQDVSVPFAVEKIQKVFVSGDVLYVLAEEGNALFMSNDLKNWQRVAQASTCAYMDLVSFGQKVLQYGFSCFDGVHVRNALVTSAVAKYGDSQTIVFPLKSFARGQIIQYQDMLFVLGGVDASGLNTKIYNSFDGIHWGEARQVWQR